MREKHGEMGEEMGELYRALAQIRDDYLSHAISHQIAIQRIQAAREQFKPSWWQDQVMVLAIQGEYHRRVIRGQWFIIALLCLIIVLLLGALILPVVLHMP
jgi:hypothetical protein